MNLLHPMKSMNIIYLALFMCFATNSLNGEPVSTNCLHCPDLAPIIEVPSTGETTIWADSLATLDVEDSCGPATYRIWYSYMDSTDYPDQRKDWALPSDSATASEVLDQLPEAAVFYCESLREEAVAFFQVRIYRIDTLGQWEVCETRVTLHDIYALCFDDGESRIYGEIKDYLGRPINLAHFELRGGYNNLVYQDLLVGEDGKFLFYLYHGFPWVLKGTREGDAINGVDVEDLILLNQHLNGIELTDNPYKIIGSDVNGDLSVNILDLLELRSVILGIQVEFQSVASWRVIDDEMPLDRVMHYFIPKTVMESNRIRFDTLVRNFYWTNFIAIKVGDLNGDANPEYWFSDDEDRHQGSMELSMGNRTLTPGEEITVPLQVSKDQVLSGYQFSIDFDPTALEFIGQNAGNSTGQSAINPRLADRGLLSTLWFNTDPVLFSDGDDLIELKFRVKESGQLKDHFEINSDLTPALAVDEDGRKMSIEMNWKEPTIERREGVAYHSMRVTPNPFKDNMVIEFHLTRPEIVTMELYRHDGALIQRRMIEAVAGANQLTIEGSQSMMPAGMYEVRVISQEEVLQSTVVKSE